tara:strand:+ start:4212 stop:5768 length:1557 start_codon:yes stop_codon:yes gene_type:complete
MRRKISITLIFTIFTITFSSANIVIDSTNLVPYSWSPISDIDKVLQHEGKTLPKRTTKLVESAEKYYNDAFSKMEKKEYQAAIIKYKAAMKDYKRAKLSDDALNYIRGNLALSYAHTKNKEDLAMASRYLNMITTSLYENSNWAYNIAIAWNKTNNKKEASNLLLQVIKDDEFNYQAYVTLEAIYQDSGNLKEAKKIKQKMHNAQSKEIRKKQIEKKNPKKKSKTPKKVFTPKGVKPDIQNLKIVKNDNHLQYDNVNKIKERSMTQVQEGIGNYNTGVNALGNKEYVSAQTNLKNAEKKLKRGKISNDGLSFTRGNLAIAYLCSGDKRSVGQAKRYLKYLSPKIYKTREWTYNLAVAHYAFAAKQKSKNMKSEYMGKAIKYLKWSIKYDKLFLPAHENLIYIYKELNENGKAKTAQNNYEKARNELMKSFSREEQLEQGGEAYVFRINLGTYGEFDTPVGLFDQDNLIIVPISESKTTYLAGIFDNLDSAVEYQKKMKKSGYKECFITAFKDGDKIEF